MIIKLIIDRFEGKYAILESQDRSCDITKRITEYTDAHILR